MSPEAGGVYNTTYTVGAEIAFPAGFAFIAQRKLESPNHFGKAQFHRLMLRAGGAGVNIFVTHITTIFQYSVNAMSWCVGFHTYFSLAGVERG